MPMGLEQKLLAPMGCRHTFSVLIRGILNYKGHHTQVQRMVYLQVFGVSPHADVIYQRSFLTASNFAYVTQLT